MEALVSGENVVLDMEKLKTAVLYICQSVEVERLGNVKLHKILYFSDMLWYSETGLPMTGVRYQKQQFGPMARELRSALRQLESEGSLKLQRRKFYGFEKMDFVAMPGNSTLSNRLSRAECNLIDAVTDFVCDKSAKEISELSHNEAWLAAEFGEDIPYYSVFGWGQPELTDDDMKNLHQVVQSLPPKENVRWFE
jgi:uncharacterized phage-associated protein